MQRILIVEDERIVARDISQQLTELGYGTAGIASRGDHAISMAGDLRPDLVLMDIHLAGKMDGIEAAQAIHDRFGLPVVFLTAFATDEVLARAKRTEPFGYVLKPFTERELRTVLEMALYKHAAENRLQQNALQLKALSQRVLEVQEFERRRVARELHEELGQALAAIKINLQSPTAPLDRTTGPRDAENLRIVDGALRLVRQLALALRPSMLDDLGLVAALRWLAAEASTQGRFEVRVRAANALPRTDAQTEIVCFRVAQEALSNVVRHAHAKRVQIYVYRNGHSLVLGIKDDGIGFDLAQLDTYASPSTNLGVFGMRERATLIGGRLEINSPPGRGCTVRLSCPWFPADWGPRAPPGTDNPTKSDTSQC
jgi:signal transduction histidine kinase